MLRFVLLLAMGSVAAFLLYFVGTGVYLGNDVRSGLAALGRSLVFDELIVGPQRMVDPSEVAADFREVVWAGELESEALAEASGLAVSGHSEEILFSVNDSGNEPRLFALDTRGRHIASYRIDYGDRHDFESLAGFELDGEHFILVADTGDNLYWRPEVHLLVLKEPDTGTTQDDSLLPVEWQVDLTYPDGYRDVEAVAVDTETGQVLLVSKRHVPAEVFEVPLKPGQGVVEARPVARLTGLPQPGERDRREDPVYGKYRSVPTGLDIRGRSAIVMTYRDAYLYERKRRQGWQEAFSGVSTRIPLPDIWGLESGAITRDGDYLYVLGEREDGTGRSGLYRVELP